MWAARSDDIPLPAAGPALAIVVNPGSGEHNADATRETLVAWMLPRAEDRVPVE